MDAAGGGLTTSLRGGTLDHFSMPEIVRAADLTCVVRHRVGVVDDYDRAANANVRHCYAYIPSTNLDWS